ncbi:hypothetical protein ACXO4P_07420 [Lactobacillus delbrueckii subsp. bulgaricus]
MHSDVADVDQEHLVIFVSGNLLGTKAEILLGLLKVKVACLTLVNLLGKGVQPLGNF